MITVHHLEASRSQRILWLLEELGAGYEVKRYARDKKTMLAPNSLRAVHPLGKSPIITDGDITLAESGAITEYLIGAYGPNAKDGTALIPPEGAERRDYTFWLHHAEGSAMPPLVLKLIFQEIPRQSPALLRPLMKGIGAQVGKAYIDPSIANHLRFWETSLAKTGWFAGASLTGADIMMSFPIEAATARGAIGGDYSNLRKFTHTIQARPAYQRALERGGPYPYA
jgi:glutathione S-transferase